MLLQALIIVALAFVLATGVRIALGRRYALAQHTSLIAGLIAAAGLAVLGRWTSAVIVAGLSVVLHLARRDGASRPQTPPAGDPEAEAARRLLGVGPGADAESIRAAYRREMLRAHPDRGGSDAQAAALTAARDALLRRLG